LAENRQENCHNSLWEYPVARVVLVVDDEPLVLHVTVGMLEDLGCEVISATNGLEALEKLSAEPRVEVLITDVNMPGMDGYELVDAAMNLRDGLKVIMLSGRLGDGRGFPLIRKPFLQKDLIKTMAAHTGLC
jgi:two-component system, cell cycle response regulator CpdR